MASDSLNIGSVQISLEDVIATVTDKLDTYSRAVDGFPKERSQLLTFGILCYSAGARRGIDKHYEMLKPGIDEAIKMAEMVEGLQELALLLEPARGGA